MYSDVATKLKKQKYNKEAIKMLLNSKKNKENQIKELKEQIYRLTWDYLYRISKENEDNVVFSPLSVYTLLSMAADATAGKTKREIVDDLFNGIAPERALSALSELLQQVEAGDEFSDANAVMINESIKCSVQPNYPDHLKELFRGELFSANDMVPAVNSWVEKQTRGMIQGIADDSMKEMLLCLINACSFIAKWKKEYEHYQVQNEDFHNSDGTDSRVRMLSSSEHTYFENRNYIGFAKPYKGEQFAFVALLPRDIGFTEGSFAALDLTECLARTENVIARVLLPEFHCSSDFDLTDTLKEKGIRTIFTRQADFSPISSAWLKAEAIKHKAYIEVDRQGTKAAAVTSMMGFAGAALHDLPEVREVFLDRPFIYFIVHQDTGIPVFAGMIRHLDPLGDDEDRLTDQEKEELCKPVYDDICSTILDENGILKDRYDRTLFRKAHEAYFSRDLETLHHIVAELEFDKAFNMQTDT